jgi:REP element-mobilizing transposase RayT
MARIARVVVEGVPYHVTQRGNGRRRAFSFDAWQAEYGLWRWREVLLSNIDEEAMARRIRESTRCG